MNDQYDLFFSEELNVFRLTPIDIGIYGIIACLAIILVRVCGPVSIKKYSLEIVYDEDNGVVNVAYRIVAPIIWCYILLLLFALLAHVLNANFSLSTRWIPLALYWIVLLLIKIERHLRSAPIWIVIVEAITSLAISIYLDWAVIRQFPQLGLMAIDQSNVGFQITIALFFAIVQFVTSTIIKRQRQSNNPNLMQYKVHLPSEAVLYAYRRKYGSLLPASFQEDILLRVFFYSIMFIEDFNRPPLIRRVERLACRMNLAKTTGIMQQKSTEPLSDEESVLAAIPKVKSIWAHFLEAYSRYYCKESQLVFARTWYEYDYALLALAACRAFPLLHGEYCGTRLLKTAAVFQAVRSFEERELQGIPPQRVAVSGSLFEEVTSLFPNELLKWENDEIFFISSDREANVLYTTIDRPQMTDIREAVFILQKEGAVFVSAKISVGFYCQLRTYFGHTNNVVDLQNTSPRWRRKHIDP